MAFPKYSIVIPAYNESARIPATLESVVACIRARQWPAEVIVVNDGSTDSTAQLVRNFARNAPEVRLVENPGNRGKGYSVRSGILQAQGEIVMFTDSDLSAPIEEAERLFAAIANGADIAIGSRWLESGRQTHRQPLYRQFFRTLLQHGLPHGDESAVCGYPVRFQGVYPVGGADGVPTAGRLSAGASIRRFSLSRSNADSGWLRCR